MTAELERRGRLMKAIICTQYGTPVLKLQDVPQPVPEDGKVLVQVRAASLNAVDWHGMHGGIARLFGGLRRPKDPRLGVDLAGRVEAVGRNVTRFNPGDEVFGACAGAFAEYATVREDRLVPKPANVSFEQAVAGEEVFVWSDNPPFARFMTHVVCQLGSFRSHTLGRSTSGRARRGR